MLLLQVANTYAQLPGLRYYDYDDQLPLMDSLELQESFPTHAIYQLSYQSTHNKRVKALFTTPLKAGKHPVVLLLHGVGDSKSVDYIEFSHDHLVKSGYAVLRIDIDEHGDRKVKDYKFSMTGTYRYWSRDVVTQTVFDLRRAVDFLETRSDIDLNRIGYFGISLGGIIGTIFSAVDQRIQVPIIVIAGGGFNMLFGIHAFSESTTSYLSIFDPIHFVAHISPRPLLMLNAEEDEIIPPILSQNLYDKAGEPKEIIWYPSTHRTVPLGRALTDAEAWFEKHMPSSQ